MGEGAEADGVGVGGEGFHLGIPLEVVPGDVGNDVVGGLSGGVELDEDGAGGAIGIDLDVVGGHIALAEVVEELVAEGIFTDAGDDDAPVAKLMGVDGEVEGRAAEPHLVGEDVVECFAEADDGSRVVHGCLG